VKAPLGLLGFDGMVSLPSENSTMRAGGVSPPPITAPTVAMACGATLSNSSVLANHSIRFRRAGWTPM
jgi:hypothetical protein